MMHHRGMTSQEMVGDLRPTWPKRCGCGRAYSCHEWELLIKIGEMVDDVESIELRNCPCGSTIAQVIA